MVRLELQDGFEHEVKVSEINEYHYETWRCSEESYYQCVAKRVNQTLLENYEVSFDPQFLGWNVFSDLTDYVKFDIGLCDYDPTSPVYWSNTLSCFHPVKWCQVDEGSKTVVFHGWVEMERVLQVRAPLFKKYILGAKLVVIWTKMSH